MLSEKMKEAVLRVISEKCNTSQFAVYDAFSFTASIPNYNRELDTNQQVGEVAQVLSRSKAAVESINQETEQSRLSNKARQGLVRRLPNGKETLTQEDILKTAHIVAQDQAGIRNTFAQFAYDRLMKDCQIDGIPLQDMPESHLPPIKIIAHKDGKNIHNFVLVGYDTEQFNMALLDEKEDEYLIIDLWLFALGFKGALNCGVYTFGEFPKSFLANLNCIYDNRYPVLVDNIKPSQYSDTHFARKDLSFDEKLAKITKKLSQLLAKKTQMESEIDEKDQVEPQLSQRMKGLMEHIDAYQRVLSKLDSERPDLTEEKTKKDKFKP